MIQKLRSTEWAKKYGYKSMTECIKKVFSLYPNPEDLHFQRDWATYYHQKHFEYVEKEHGIIARKELEIIRQPDGKDSVRFNWMKVLGTMQDKGKIKRMLRITRKQRGDNGARAKREKGIPVGLPHGKY